MNVLVIQHMESEGVGTLGHFLEKQGWTIETARLYEGHKLLKRAIDYDLVVSMGGAMNVYEEDSFSFLADETDFLKQGIADGANILGVCLGAQMIAKASGASVVSSPSREIGWGKVYLNESGISDRIFFGVKTPLKVFQWHEDMFHTPESGSLLAYSDLCPHQAFRVNRAYGFQFHIEVGAEMLESWFAETKDLESYLSYYRDHVDELKVQSEIIYSNLVNMIEG